MRTNRRPTLHGTRNDFKLSGYSPDILVFDLDANNLFERQSLPNNISTQSGSHVTGSQAKQIDLNIGPVQQRFVHPLPGTIDLILAHAVGQSIGRDSGQGTLGDLSVVHRVLNVGRYLQRDGWI